MEMAVEIFSIEYLGTIYRVPAVSGEHDGVVAQDVDVVRGSPHPGDLLRSWLLVCHESKCVHFDAPLK